MVPLLLTIRGIAEDYCGNKGMAFKYFTKGFDYQTSEKPGMTEWQYVIENNFKIFCDISNEHLDKNMTQLNNCLTTLNDNVIKGNAWIQWATLIHNYFNQLDVKDVNIALTAMKCYIIASKLTSNIKHTAVMANVC